MNEPLWAGFDAEWYRARYRHALGDLVDASAEELADHYVRVGKREKFSPNRFFDEAWYLQAHPDVAAAVEAGAFASGFDHYRSDGFINRSPHWLFSETAYLARYPDLTRATLDRLGVINGYDHYLRYGDREFRSGHLFFDPHLYYANALVSGPDSSSATTIPAAGPFTSFLSDEAQASRFKVSWYFDPEWYLNTYPEAAAAVNAGEMRSALHHFLTNTTPGVYNALEWFIEDYYLGLYPDIADAIAAGKLRSAYDHFVHYGTFERRKPHPDVDLNTYFFSGRVRSDIERGLVRDVFVHWLSRRHQRPLDADLDRPDLKMFEGLAVRKAENLIPLLVRRPLDFTVSGEAEVSVVLFARNRLPLTLSALSALRMTFPGALDVIVVDGGSQDDTTRLEHFVKGIRILRLDRSTTHAEALQAALPHLNASAVLWLGQGMRLSHGALQAALRELKGHSPVTKTQVGIVAGRVLRADGRIGEAGVLLGRDGTLTRYLEGADMSAPEACFRRDIACTTEAAFLIDRALLQQLAGFDAAFEASAMQIADLCLGAGEAGFRIVHEPAMIVSEDVHDGDATAITEADRRLLRQRHAATIRKAWPPASGLAARARSVLHPSAKRILFIEDQVPARSLGSGFVRSNDIVRTMAVLGHQVTVYPIYASTAPLPAIYADFPADVEVLHDRGFDTFEAFLQERSGAYDCVWIGRTHNIGRMMPVLMAQAAALPLEAIVLDTEAVTAPRTVLKANLFGEPLTQTLDEALEAELADAWLCRMIVAVNALDVRILRAAGYENVAELGHMCPVRPTPRKWGERRDMLFLGAIHEPNAPNHDSLIWFVDKVLPLLKDRLPEDVRFTVAGFRGASVDLSALGRDPRVELVGPVKDAAALYASHRIFVAPTRFAGGIPFKIHEAASYGLPVVASDLLCRQLDWRSGLEIVSGGDNDSQRFADQIVALYTDEDLWNTVRHGALRMLESENSPRAYSVRLNSILQEVLAPAR
ncbi:glycosyltransferase [Acetobacter sp. LMG 1627]|uniref:Glycosyltransferase n=2 Tax=Acetobacter conturbans TaxID=1737472 RepID=A0ABX0JZ89_9PROT|nr:glycosyltransferase [Acetobacter conturbans]NHN88817.1 glycosyltransferase [Acetobacter conturbans]